MGYRDEKETLRRRVEQLEAELAAGADGGDVAEALRGELSEARDEIAHLGDALRGAEAQARENAREAEDLEAQLEDLEAHRGTFAWFAPATSSAPYYFVAAALLGAFVWGMAHFEPGALVGFFGGVAFTAMFFGLRHQERRDRRRDARNREAAADAARLFSRKRAREQQRRRVRVDTRREEVEVRARQAARNARRR